MTKKEIKSASNTDLLIKLMSFAAAYKVYKYMLTDAENICHEMTERGFDIDKQAIIDKITH